MDQREYYDFINIAKLILAVAILAMHSALVPDDSVLMLLLCRLGVPYFFVASGFFLWKKCADDHCDSAVKKYIRRLALPYAVFSVVWIVQLLIDDAIGHVGVREAAIQLIQYILFYPRGALWYIWASIFGVLMLYPFMRKKRLIRALPLGIVLFAVGLLANSWYFLAAGGTWLKPTVDAYLRIFLVSNNAPFVGFVFLLIGMLMRERYDKIAEAAGIKTGLFALLLSCALLLFEASYVRGKANSAGDGAFYLSQLIFVPAVFYLTTRIRCPHLSKSFITTAKWLSTGVYFLHVPILWIIHRTAKYVLPRIPLLDRTAPLFDHPSVCFTGCLLICLTVCLLAYRRPDSFLCKILK